MTYQTLDMDFNDDYREYDAGAYDETEREREEKELEDNG